jgi:hypothetical protein
MDILDSDLGTKLEDITKNARNIVKGKDDFLKRAD